MTAKFIFFTIITVALLATLVALVALHAPELAMITVATALGGAIQATFGLAKSTDSDKSNGAGGAAAVLVAVGAVLAGESAGCGLPPAVESGLNTAGVAILCSLQAEELNDPALNADCAKLLPTLSPSQRAAVARHTSRAAARSVTAPDGGAP